MPAPDSFPTFAAAVNARLESGNLAEVRNFDLPPALLAAELENEAIDVATWAFIMWRRLRRFNEATGKLSLC